MKKSVTKYLIKPQCNTTFNRLLLFRNKLNEKHNNIRNSGNTRHAWLKRSTICIVYSHTNIHTYLRIYTCYTYLYDALLDNIAQQLVCTFSLSLAIKPSNLNSSSAGSCIPIFFGDGPLGLSSFPLISKHPLQIFFLITYTSLLY